MRSEVTDFSRDMERKLRANEDKGGWDTCEIEWLFRRLRDEADELAGAIGSMLYAQAIHGDCMASRAQNVIDEAADVANFAMMIADNVRKLTKEAA